MQRCPAGDWLRRTPSCHLISLLATEEYIRNRAQQARKGAFKRILGRVPDQKPMLGDEMK
jgi:hypothetical protein